MPFSPPEGFDGLKQIVSGLFFALAGVWSGRLMWHAEEVRAGRRRFFSRDLVLDMPVVAGMTLLSWGASEYLGLGPGEAAAIGSLLGWLGPRGSKAILEQWARRRLARDEGGKP